MKKLRNAAVLLLCMSLLLTACGTTSTSGDGSADNPEITVSTADVTGKVLEQTEISGIDTTLSKGEDLYESNFASLYTFDEKLITDGSIAYDSTGSTADEITILRVADKKDLDTVKAALKSRIKQRATDFGGYKPEETSKVNNAVVFSCSNYVILAICDDPSAARSSFMKIMQEA